MKNQQPFFSGLSVATEILVSCAIFCLPIAKAATEVTIIAAMVCWILYKIIAKIPLLPASKAVIFYSLLLGIILLSLIQAPPFLVPEGLRGVLKWLKYLGIFFMCWDIYREPKKQTRLFLVFLASMLVVSLDGFYQLHTGIDLLRKQTLDPGRIVRMKACLGAPNLLASFLLFAMPLSVSLFVRSRAWLRALWGTAFFVFATAFFLTYSRGAFYAMALSLLLNLFALKRIKFALIAIGCLTVLIFTVPSLRYNFVETIERKDITIAERGDYWKVAFNMIKQHPILGVGVNTYHSKFPSYAPDPTVRQAYPHNSYLQMASEIGLPGLFVFILALGYAFRRSFKLSLAAETGMIPLRIALFAFLLQGFFDNNLYALQAAYLFWGTWGVFHACIFRVAADTQIKKNNPPNLC